MRKAAREWRVARTTREVRGWLPEVPTTGPSLRRGMETSTPAASWREVSRRQRGRA